jgi:uncharacterized protein YbaP (TraB family)
MIKTLRALGALLVLLLAAFTSPAFARQVGSHRHDHAVQAVRPALWKIEGPAATIYLFGTIHALTKDVAWYEGPVRRAFEGSDTLVTEIVEPSPEALKPIVMARAMLPAGPSLRDMLTPDERQLLETTLAANKLPVAGFDRYQPWYAAVALATFQIFRAGYDPANGVDSQLGLHAQALGKGHEALETVDYQLGLFAGLPLPLQKTYLMQVVKDLPKVQPELLGIIRAWKAGNAGTLAKLMNSDEDDPQMMKVLLIDRNTNWAKWIEARLANTGTAHKTLFVAVGAGHLAGKGSVMDQLKALGIASRRVE